MYLTRNYFSGFQLDFDTEEAAVEAVRRSRSHGVLYFPKNFSQHLMSRVKEQTDATAAALDGSVITVRLDMSGNFEDSTSRNKLQD